MTNANGNLDFFSKLLEFGTTFKVERMKSDEQFDSRDEVTETFSGKLIGGGGNCKSVIGGGRSFNKSVEYNWFMIGSSWPFGKPLIPILGFCIP